MLASERPKISLARRRPIFTADQLEQTIAAAAGPYRTLFVVAALTGARVSELCGPTWANVRLDDLDEAEIEFGGRSTAGQPPPDEDDGSARTVPIPRDWRASLQVTSSPRLIAAPTPLCSQRVVVGR